MLKILTLSAGLLAVSGCSNMSYQQSAALDVATTVVALNNGASELNPLLNKLGGGSAVGVGLAASGLKAGFYYAARKQSKPNCEQIIKTGKALNVGAGVNNVLQLAGLDSVPSLMIGIVAGTLQYKRAKANECRR